jgi:hypothetical protein
LADLLALIHRRRQRWFTAVPRLGYPAQVCFCSVFNADEEIIRLPM